MDPTDRPTFPALPPPVPPLIVVVDDSPVACTIIGRCLREAGFRVKTYTDPLLFLRDVLAEGASPPALAIVDLVMARMDGITLTKHLKQRLPQMPVIVVSGERTRTVDRLYVYLAGARHFLAKPFRVEEIRTLAHRVLGCGHLRP